jgi:predicted nucleic acid-binding protein
MYLIDTNVLIEAKNRYYAFDMVPGFWDWLKKAHLAGDVRSIKPVEQELVAGSDDLAAWASKYPSFFDPIDAATSSGFSRLTAWANSRNYDQRAINEFTGQNADYMLIAHAMAHRFTVVTNERPSPDSRKRILIPDACAAMGVNVSDTFTMMRRCGVRLCHQ